MKVWLTYSWNLTTQSTANPHSVPVLIHTQDNHVYGPEDTLQGYLGWPPMTAAAFVRRMISTKKPKLTASERYLIERFTRDRHE